VLGDLFELWVGDDGRDAPFFAECVERLAAPRRAALAVMVGNRDFLMGEVLMQACRATALPDPTLLEAFGRRVLLSHGDALCLDDLPYQRFRAEVRTATWQQRFLARPLEERLRIAADMRAASASRRAFDGDAAVDIDRPSALALLRAAAADTLVHGHTHRPGTEALVASVERHVLSDWDLDHADRAEVLRFSARGFERLPPAGPRRT
jgi:UDP-2,3-diacylglucosamine hydrolase